MRILTFFCDLKSAISRDDEKIQLYTKSKNFHETSVKKKKHGYEKRFTNLQRDA